MMNYCSEKLKIMDNEEKAKKLIEFVNKADSYDLYEYTYDKQSVQSFFNYSVLQKIHCCARNIFNVLIYFAENIERLNKRKEIDMFILYAYKKSDKKKENLLDSYFTFKINPEYCFKYYCEINEIEEDGVDTYTEMIDELDALRLIKFVNITNFEEPMACTINNFFYEFELIIDHEALNTEMYKITALCTSLSVCFGEKNHENIAKVSSESINGFRRKYTNEIIIKMKLNNFIEIFSSASYKTKQLNDFIQASYSNQV